MIIRGTTLRRRTAMAVGPAALLAMQAANRLPIAFAQARGGTFVFGAPGDAVKLDPANVTDGESARVTEQIFDTLVMFDGSTTNLKPGLAESWDVTADGLSYFFNLRPGVRFHDGTPLDAMAVKWNFDRWMDASHPYHTGGEFEYWTDTAGFNEVIRRVAVVDANTVQIDLSFPQGPFLLNLALFAFAIASPTALAADIENAYRNPVGTGAFRFVEWVPGDRIVLERNPDYWGEQASVERVVIRIVPDNAARFLALRSGAIDIMDGPNPDDVRNARGDRSLSVITRPPLNVGYINMNLKERPFSDTRVRHAVASAINRQAIVDALYGGSGMVASQLIPPSLLGWNPEVTGPQYDPARARQLLAEAGYPSGFATDFWYMPVSRPYFPDPRAIAEAIAADLARVDIRVSLKTEDWGSYLQDRNQLKFPIWMLGWIGDNGDPDNFLYTFFGNFAQDNSWDNETVRGLLRQAQRSADFAERDRIYRQVNQVVEAEVPRIPIAHNAPSLLARAYVKGYIANPTQTEFFNTVWLDR